MLYWILKTGFRLLGWKVINPPTIRKGLCVVAPHNSNADFFVGLSVRPTINLDIKYLGKSELFRPPFAWFFRALGGIPVDRAKNNNFVQQVANLFKKHDDLLLSLAPEGTRKNVSKLRTGFYYMAQAAQVPIVMAGFDYPRKSVIFAEPFMVSGDFQADMKKYFIPFFKQIQGFQKDWLKNYEEGKFDEPSLHPKKTT